MKTFVTPNGEELAILPVDEYKRLAQAAEELNDIVEGSRVLAEIEAGQQEAFPAELVDRLDSEHPIRVFREHRGLKAKDLAAKAGIAQGYLSEIESGKKEGSLKALKAISDALGVDLDLLVW